MNIKLLSMGLAIAIASGATLLNPEIASTAIPPLSVERLNDSSDYIVIGTVTNIQVREVRVNLGTDYSYKAQIQVNRIELSRSDVLNSKKSIEVHYRKTGKRPYGWTGPQGQSQLLEKGKKVKLFIRRDRQGNLHLLEPNGWQLITMTKPQ
jgi:hypothetical protein